MLRTTLIAAAAASVVGGTAPAAARADACPANARHSYARVELFREGAVGFDQVTPLGELTVRWTGASAESDEFQIDEFEGAPEPPDVPEEQHA